MNSEATNRALDREYGPRPPGFVSFADLLDRKEVCHFFGGNRPLNAATLYRGIRKGRYPAPVKVGPGSSRWLRAECEASLRAMVEGRGR